jgi:hypothetical protein
MYSGSMLLFLANYREHHRELIADAETYRLLAAARRRRRRNRDAGQSAGAREHPAGNLAGCGPSVAAPAR